MFFGDFLLRNNMSFSIHNYTLADIGFYINLDSATERKNFIDSQIQKFYIHDLYRFSALTDPHIQSSCTKSHLAVFELALSQGYKSIFIGEDDFEIYSICKYTHNINIELEIFLNNTNNFILNNNYDVLLLGCNPKTDINIYNKFFGYNFSSTGAWAYIIKDKAMNFILNNFNYDRDRLAIDDILPLLNNYGMKTLLTIPMIIGHRNGIPSTLQPYLGNTYYSTWINGNWDKHLYEKIEAFTRVKNYIDIQEILETYKVG